MAVQGPPLRALPVSPCVHVGYRRRPYPVTGSGHQDPQLPRRLAHQRNFQWGLRVYWEKSKLSPVQRISFLGVELDSVSMTACLTDDRAQAVLNCLSSFRGSNVVPLKLFQRLLGHMASAAAVTEAQVDQFASHNSSQRQLYFSLTEGPLGTDALAHSWPRALRKYAFPPVSLLAQTLCKLREDEEQVLLVAPHWPTRTWFPELISLTTAPPWRIPLRKDLLSQGLGTIWHPRPDLWNLHVWLLDGTWQT